MKDFIKSIVFRTFSPELALKLRRHYLVREIIKKAGSNETEYLLLRDFISEGDSVIDIGANVGAYTKEFSRLAGNSGRVYAFEPVGENFIILEAVIQKAKLRNVTAFRAALGAEPGVCDIVVPEMEGYTGYYWAHLAKSAESGLRESVEVRTLDELAGEQVINTVDFIKCDVEGGELDVLRGSGNILRRHRPGWIIEVSKSTSGDVFDYFHDMGYAGFVYDGRLRNTPSYRDKEFSNYFFFHTESAIWERAKQLIN